MPNRIRYLTIATKKFKFREYIIIRNKLPHDWLLQSPMPSQAAHPLLILHCCIFESTHQTLALNYNRERTNYSNMTIARHFARHFR